MTFLESLADNLMDLPIMVTGSLSINGQPAGIMDYLKKALPSLNQARQELKTRFGQLAEPEVESPAYHLNVIYLGYAGIVDTYNQLSKVKTKN